MSVFQLALSRTDSACYSVAIEVSFIVMFCLALGFWYAMYSRSMSKRLHRREVTQILRSVATMRSIGTLVTCTRHRTPLAYFDDKPIGRILSRFSQDVFVLDFQVGNAWNNAFGLATAMIVDAIVLTVAGTPDISVPCDIADCVYVQHPTSALSYWQRSSCASSCKDSTW